MELKEVESLLKIYFEPKRREMTKQVSDPNFGWTPCQHFSQCIGWCPKCLYLKYQVEKMNADWGTP